MARHGCPFGQQPVAGGHHAYSIRVGDLRPRRSLCYPVTIGVAMQSDGGETSEGTRIATCWSY
jgi:hypothetical protein